MNLRSVKCAAIAAMVCVPAVAMSQDFGAQVGVDLGGMGLGVKVDIHDPNQQAFPEQKQRVQTSSREEISSSEPGQSFKLVYEDSPSGKTLFKVLEPEGFRLRVTEGRWTVKEDSIPTSFKGQAGKFHRFEVFGPHGVVFDKKLEAKRGKVATLWVMPSVAVAVQPTVVVMAQPEPVVVMAQPEPVVHARCLPDSELASITQEIDAEGFEEEKLSVLESAMADRTLCGAQVSRVLDLYDFSSGKLKALEYMAPRIADPRNNYKILGSFDFSSDKAQAKQLLAR